METTIIGYIGYRICGIWGSRYNIPKAHSIYLRGTIEFWGPRRHEPVLLEIEEILHHLKIPIWYHSWGIG